MPPHCTVSSASPAGTTPSLMGRAERVDDLVKILLSEYTTMVGSAREDGDIDYSQSSQKELQIKENAMSIVCRL